MDNWISQSRTKFSLWVVITMLLMLLVITSIVVLEISKQAKEDYLTASTDQMMTVSKTLINFYATVYEDINTFANDPLIMNADSSITSYITSPEVPMTPSKNGGIEQTIYEKFNLYGENHKSTVYAYLALANGSYIEWPETIAVANYNPTLRPWYSEGMLGNGKVISTDSYIHLRSKSIITSNVRAFSDPNGRIAGVVGIDIKGDVISNILQELKIGKTGFYMMIHRTGIILADGNNEENNFEKLDDMGVEALNQVYTTDAEPFEVYLNGTSYIVNPYTIQDTQWVLASFMTEDELFAGAIRLTNIISIFALIMLLVIGLLLRIFIRQTNTIFSMIYFDSLTGLNNRHSMFKSIDISIKNDKKNGNMAIIFLDIDQFQVINNTYGQETGDDVLKHLGNQFKTLQSTNISIGRMSGDEFLIFLKNQEDTTTIIDFADRVLRIFNENLILNGKTIYLSASMGIALFSDACNHRNLLTRNADLALKKAKKSGKNKYVLYEGSLNIALEEKIIFQNAIRNAIKSKEFFLNYQPIVDTNKGEITGYEALIRWISNDYGYVSPLKLITNIEEMGLIIEIGEWILKQACAFATNINHKSNSKVSVSVNISTIQLMSNNFYESVSEIVESANLSPDLLCLEVTETVLMESLHKGLTVVNKLRAQGIKIALDDFGTGYSSLSYLNTLPIDILKIDKSYVDNVVDDAYSQYIINILIKLAQFKNVAIVSEGVEHTEQLDVLSNYGCNVFQGYLFSKPLDEKTALDFQWSNSTTSGTTS